MFHFLVVFCLIIIIALRSTPLSWILPVGVILYAILNFLGVFRPQRRRGPPSVIILGGTRGLGAALALEFRRRFPTTRIYAVARRRRDPDERVPGVTYVRGDVMEASQWDVDAMFPDTDEAWVINCAGMARCSLFCDTKDIAQATQCMIDTNLTGTLHSAWALLRGSERKYIMVSSVVAHMAVPGYAVYRTSKYALRGLYEALCAEGLSQRVGIVYANTMLTEGYEEEEAAGKPTVTKRIERCDTPTRPRVAAAHVINRMLTHGPHGVMMTSGDMINWFFCSPWIDVVPLLGWWKRCALAFMEWTLFPHLSTY